MASLVLGQATGNGNTGTGNGNTGTGTGNGNTGTGNGNTGTGGTNNGGTTTTTPGNNGNSNSNNVSAPCVPSVNTQPGAIFLLAPNANNIATNYGVIGGNLNITWTYNVSILEYSGVVTCEMERAGTMTPNSINIYWAYVPKANALEISQAPTPKTFYGNPLIAQNLPGATTSFIWPISGLQPGNYLLRIVADGLDPQYYMEVNPGQSQCYKQGQAFPGVSLSPFMIAGNNQLVSYPDHNGPSSLGARVKVGLVVGFVGLCVSLLAV
ncbi:hypothetical protein HDU98_006176 [Podochytrium sp. JEL0797]|nr:hypothetical protein HDU98_006176 [Podochytrium sp. JEL0797]